MAHYKTMYDDSDMLFSHDLGGREVTVQIKRVYGGELIGEKGRKSKKPFVEFVGKQKKLALNKSNGKTIARMYGTDTKEWEGKWLTLYPTTTEFGGETVDCIRIRPKVPTGKGSAKQAAEPESPPDADDRDDFDPTDIQPEDR